MPQNFPTLLLITTVIPFAAAPLVADEPLLQQARGHVQHGRYAEADEAWQKLAENAAFKIPVALAKFERHKLTGDIKSAAAALESVTENPPKSADVQAALAELEHWRGNYTSALTRAQTALKLNSEHLRARLVLADTQTELGDFKSAQENYVWFVRHYNRVQPEEADTLMFVARGSLQYARWKSSSQIFRFILNTLAPDALKQDAACWQAHYLAGSILLEKYNRAQALPELERALAINPHAGPVLVALASAAQQSYKLEDAADYAERALKVNPHDVAALHIQADLAIQAGKPAEAQQLIDKALKVNPHDQRTLARQAAVLYLEHGPLSDAAWQALRSAIESRQYEIKKPPQPGNADLFELMLSLHQRNPAPGEFWNLLGELLEGRRKFEIAADCFQLATQVMPQLASARTNLGMLYMRVGKTAEAEGILNSAFTADPFHVRVSNLRKVLKLLNDYATIETDHFIIRVDNTQDQILGHYMAEYLEEIYPELTRQFGYEPPGRTIFEIYHDGKGLSAHQWFSARMVGLPWIQTIGASTGKIVALASPTAVDQDYNWARVLKHEYVHIITLQQTGFNIPHWFTEALAVTSEGTPYPGRWNELLLERVPRGELWNLTNLNDGFIRPESPDDWQFAYCQSRLYAQYMIETFGQESVARLLNAYRANLPTEKAIPQVFNMPLQEFEAGYVKFVKDIVSRLQVGQPQPVETTLADAEKAWLADPGNTTTATIYARELLKAAQFEQAGELAVKLHEKNPQDAEVALIVAQLQLRKRQIPAARKTLEAALNKKQPHPRLLELLAGICLIAKDAPSAIDHFELGRSTFPYDIDWDRGLAKACTLAGNNEKLIPVLERLVDSDGDDPAYRKKLMQLAFAEGDYERAVRFGKLVIEIDAVDPEVHRVIGQSFLALKQPTPAVREFEFALKLDPGDEAATSGLKQARELLKLPGEN